MKKDKKKLLTSILAGFLALMMLLSLLAMIAPYVSAKTSSQLKEELDILEARQEEIQKELQGLQNQVDENMNEMEQIVAEKNQIDQEIFLLYEQQTNINTQISTYNDLIADKQQELDEAQAALDELQLNNKERIRSMEKNSSTGYWSVVFNATSFLDMLDRLKMINEIQAADRALIASMREAAQAVATAKDELETDKLALEDTKKELEENQVLLESKRSEADALLTQLIARGEEYEALVEEAESKKQEIDSEVSDKQDEYDTAKEQELYAAWLAQQQAQQLAQQQAQQSASSNTGGTAGTANTVTDDSGATATWLVPINYTRFSSPFGYRIHPVYGDYRFHYGVDLGAPTGTPIIATRSGTVTTATYGSSGGYYVYIDHGDGYRSAYLHMTHYIVSVGQQVTAGQVIGYCGSTGCSTGPHLHFSIYKNGVAVNPALYIDI